MKWFLRLAAFCLGLGIALPAFAQSSCVLPEILQNGTVADANQVMNNFNTLTGCINNQRTGVRITPQTLGAVGDGATDDTAAVQAAINAASAAGVPLHFDMVHKYLITSPLKVTAPIDIEGQYRYGIWAGQDPSGVATIACPWGLINNGWRGGHILRTSEMLRGLADNRRSTRAGRREALTARDLGMARSRTSSKASTSPPAAACGSMGFRCRPCSRQRGLSGL
jgi:hypothetical protein